jgi:AbiTii
MKLVDEIIEMAVHSDKPVSTMLRKFLLLAYELKNDKLKAWTENELSGYDKEGDLPEYRDINVVSKGTFLGPLGATMQGRPIPSLILEKEHRHYVDRAKLFQPIAAYDRAVTGKKVHDATINWPTNLVGHYQRKIIEGWALHSAWQEIPASVFISIVETVRNRVLKFTLEIRNELGEVGDKPADIKGEKVEQIMNTYIFGGVNVVAGSASGFNQIGNLNVAQGDAEGLAAALRNLGLSDTDADELQATLNQEKGTLGERTANWIREKAATLGVAGGKMSVDVAKAIVTKLIMQYLGLA